MSLEWIVTGMILLGGMIAVGIRLYIKRRKERPADIQSVHDIRNIKDENERKVAEFLTRIGFSFVASRLEFKKSDAEPSREIDLLFTFQNCLFIVEVSTVKTGRNEKIISFFCRWSRQKNLTRLKEKHFSIPSNLIRMFFDLSKPTPENKSQDVEELAEEKGNKVIYKDEFEKLNSAETLESMIVGLLGQNWHERTTKIIA